MPPKKSYRSSDIRRDVSYNVDTTRRQEVDHMAELQTITKAMNQVGVGPLERCILLPLENWTGHKWESIFNRNCSG